MKIIDKLKDFKKKELGFFGTILQFLMFHNISKIIALLVIMSVSAILYYNHDILWAWYFFLPSAGILVLIVVISIIFGCIINPIRDRKITKELLEEKKRLENEN
jgi:uncharacterized membrane protein YqjE